MSYAARCPNCDAVVPLAGAAAGSAARCERCAAEFTPARVEPVEDLAFALLTAGEPSGPAPPLPADDPDDREPDRPPRRRLPDGPARAVRFLVGVAGTVALVAATALALVRPPQAAPPPATAAPPAEMPAEPPAAPAEPPRDTAEALAALASLDLGRREAAVEWLAGAPVEAGRRADVARALVDVLEDRDWHLHAPAADALARWAGPAEADTLYGLAQREAAPGWAAALRALAVRKDPRAAGIAAAYLPNFYKRGAAARVLELIGAAAEAEVVPYLESNDPAVRREAARLLGRIGTAASLAPLATAADRDPALAPQARAAAAAIIQRGSGR